MREHASKIRILIADDHAVVREGTRAMLERERDMEVIGEAANGEEAITMIEQLKPDVAILDISMPRIGGVEVTRRIKPRYPTMGILILSIYDNDEYVFAVLEAGAAGYLLKDADKREVIEAVRAVADGESVLHPSIARKVIQRAIVGNAKAGDNVTGPDMSERETEVLKMAARGLTNKQIADVLCISVRTVQGHINSIFHKLGVGSRTEAIFLSIKRGWISFSDLPGDSASSEN
jgi:two-component system, NarL family, response regulator LiaR